MVVALAIVGGCSAVPATTEPPAASATTSAAPPLTSGSTPAPAGSATGAGEVRRRLDLALNAGERYQTLIKSVIVTVDGAQIYQHYAADSGPDVTHNVYSVTKSVISMLIGIAIDEGFIAGVDLTLAELLPTHVPMMAPGVGAITLRQILTMTGGVHADETFVKYTRDANWTELTLSTPLTQPPGTGWIYSNPGSHLLSAILVQATGRGVLDYAREKLFTPLGISTEPAAQPVLGSGWAISPEDLPAYGAVRGFGWSTDPQGLNLGPSDLKISAADMTKLGQLYLDGGRWAGQQLVPQAWVGESTSALVPTDYPLFDYGYQWRAFDAGGHPAFAAFGLAGQLIEVVPDLHLVVAISSLDDPARFDTGELVQLVQTYIIPVLTR
jgi:CubicO group peptidase (beta-lactamase class C family)